VIYVNANNTIAFIAVLSTFSVGYVLRFYNDAIGFDQ